MTTGTQLPHWDMTVVFPGLESQEFRDAFGDLVRDIEGLTALFDQHGIHQSTGQQVSGQTVEVFDAVIPPYIELCERYVTLGAFVSSFVSTDSRNSNAQAWMSELQAQSIPLSQLSTRLTAWVGSLTVGELIRRSEVARDHVYWLQKTRISAQHQMPEAEENLADELSLTGGSAWGRLHGNLTSQIMVPVTLDGKTEEYPMSVVRNMAHLPDREQRRAAYDAELQAWERAAVPLAAALNSIKGETNTLNSHRAWQSGVDLALFNNNIDRATLDAMLEAARASFPDWRRYLDIKAQVLGLEKLAWYDIFAPLGGDERARDFSDAADFLLEQFGSYSPRLRDLADRAFREHWIDAEPRPGKRDGAFCMWVRRGESRVMSNYEPSYRGMSTLAHELGHAYHNLNLADRTLLQRGTPMTLAETASIFCETIVREAALERAERQEQVTILEASLENACQLVVDISSRFIFEQSLFEGRRQRELSIAELNELMLDAQRQTYGEGVQGDALHPYMWAVKGHYYSVGRPFYNFPYMFGFLFGLGLYAQYRQDPDRFRSGYDRLLSSTGLADVAELASGFGVDVRRADFWNASLDMCREDINRFQALTSSVASS